jgi:Guanine nucleotide exchange factor in Golgi transport N-terminal
MINVEYAPVAMQACFYVSSCTNPETAAVHPRLRERRANWPFSFVEADLRLLLYSELESITLRTERHDSSAPPTVRDAFAIFEELRLLGNGERPQFLQLEYFHKTLSRELIESVPMNHHEFFRKVSVFSSSFHTSSPYITVTFTAPENSYSYYNATFPATSENAF